MKIISWNVRGLGNPLAVRRLRFMLKQHNPDMVFFMKTKVNDRRMERIRRRSGFINGIEVGANGSRGGLCLAWREECKVSLRTFSKNHIDVLIEERNVQEVWRFTGFYGSLYVNGQLTSWSLLRALGQEQQFSWLICGDFNEILYSFEKSGGQPREERKITAFREVLDECQLMDMGFQGTWFTWERGNLPKTNIRERLDRGVANEKWMHLFPKGSIRHLTHSISDHCPLLIHTGNEDKFCRRSRFKFEAWWTLEESFEWASSIRRGRDGLKKELIKELGILLEGERNDDAMEKIIDTRISLNMEIDKDEMYWEQRVKANWLLLGDRNSAFFHKYASARRRTNTISRLESEEGQEVIDDLQINEVALNYFQNLFSTTGVGDSTYLLEGISTNISSEINSVLLSMYSREEIQKALKGMGPTKAPGFDGFPALFFQKYWHIVGKDVETFYLGVLNEGRDFESTNRTDIVLIPKSSHPTNLVDFRPISLCTILYKLVAKTIANKLQDFIGKCIDSAQSAFVPGRLISDNVLIAYEILHTLRQKRWGKKGLMAVKLDMSKAYDRVEWNYLKKVMLKMGFAERWVALVVKCVSTASYAVNINGIRGRVFHPTRGLRQGNLLSPYLFLICSEGLSALIRKAVDERIIKGVKASRRGPETSHLLFADDCLLFGESTKEQAIVLKAILQYRFAGSWRIFLQDTGGNMIREGEGYIGVNGNLCADLRRNEIIIRDVPHDDYLAWEGEASGVFSVCSAYKLLQTTDEFPRAYALQISYRNLYKELWLLNLPTKIKITVWKITWNFLPTRVNLQHKKLAIDPICPRCGEQAETIDHFFQGCPVTKETWSTLLLQDVLLFENGNFEEWLIWVFEQCNPRAWRLFCCALWALWGDRNLRIHEKKVSTGSEIGNFVIRFTKGSPQLLWQKLWHAGKRLEWEWKTCGPRSSLKETPDL
ncbi:reverse transcriptase [Gossypium australe]|uniref:Reverse transcriptase n=1 Tax=Gossypium australe TaxID=47621 RepID=A0A5B6UUC2_9ROSI|nr:reverse transcriptase [Gossypium australe]